jgi:hypothetical protein
LARKGGESLSNPRNPLPQPIVGVDRVHLHPTDEEERMGRGLLLWMLGIPLPIILLLWVFHVI